MFFFNSKSRKQSLSITFTIDDNDNVSIDIINHKFDNSKIFGKFLYALNKGFYMKHIFTKLTLMLDTNNDKFLTDSILEWENFLQLEHSNQPLIKPLNAFVKNVK